MDMLLKPSDRRSGWGKSPRPKKTRMSRSKIKVMLVVFLIGKTSSIMNLPHGQMINRCTRKF